MSVIVTLRVKCDPKRFEEVASSERMQPIVEQARSHGVIAHRFYGSEDGEIIGIDEWPDAQSFRSFFEASAGQIQPLMQEAGVQSEPEVTFWHKLDTGDEVGWNS